MPKLSKVRVWRASTAKGGDSRNGIIQVPGSRGYRYVSEKKRQQGLTNPWILAVKKARDQLGITGFHPLKKDGVHLLPSGSQCTVCGSFYTTARTIYDGSKTRDV